jgi:hypothetical protein
MPADVTTTEPSGIATYGSYIAAELLAQEVRKTSFEQRGLAVVTTSGVLVTLLLGLSALATKEASTFVPSSTVKGFMVGALIAFLGAAVAALTVNIPRRYSVVSPDDLRARLKEEPVRSEGKAQLDVALTGIKALRRAKKINGTKSWLLFAAIALEVIALAQLGVAVALIVGR